MNVPCFNFKGLLMKFVSSVLIAALMMVTTGCSQTGSSVKPEVPETKVSEPMARAGINWWIVSGVVLTVISAASMSDSGSK